MVFKGWWYGLQWLLSCLTAFQCHFSREPSPQDGLMTCSTGNTELHQQTNVDGLKYMDIIFTGPKPATNCIYLHLKLVVTSQSKLCNHYYCTWSCMLLCFYYYLWLYYNEFCNIQQLYWILLYLHLHTII